MRRMPPLRLILTKLSTVWSKLLRLSPPLGADASARITELEERLSNLKAQLEDRTNQSMRIAADFENYRKRTSKEKDELEAQVKGNTIIELLPVVDNFERARSQIKPQTEAEMTIHKSYQGVYKQLVDVLKRLGVSAMRTEGQEFNPLLHEAVMREPTPDHPEGTVIEEFVRGYQLGDRVLRHAMVKVSALLEGENAGEDELS
ncbi:MAG: nucleotide exchange factor GrpE [Leptolyngbyaceae cyanobacterium SM2_5_2]|nr:nucleotide exchange factor GrpE [Leptolyngbyaceae cyanobacterium SM2_5_2]